jgi:hypothetical protein
MTRKADDSNRESEMKQTSSGSTSGPETKDFRRRARMLTAVGALTAFALGAAFMSLGHHPEPHNVPIAVVGNEAVAQGLEAKAPDQLSVTPVPDLAAADRKIDERDVYGAVVPGPTGINTLVIASAASNQVANFLRNSLGQPTPQGTPKVVDAAPWPEDDSGGLAIGLLITVIVLGGTVGVVGMMQLLPRFEGDPRRGILPITYLVAYALVYGVAVAAIAAAFGVGTDAPFLERVGAMTLISLGATASTAALIALIGPAGSAVTSVLYFVLGSQISGAGTAPDFLPSFWSGLGQHLPAGAGTGLLRDLFYFPEASSSSEIAILAVYAGVGLVSLLVISVIRARRRAGESHEDQGAVASAGAKA